MIRPRALSPSGAELDEKAGVEVLCVLRLVLYTTNLGSTELHGKSCGIVKTVDLRLDRAYE